MVGNSVLIFLWISVHAQFSLAVLPLRCFSFARQWGLTNGGLSPKFSEKIAGERISITFSGQTFRDEPFVFLKNLLMPFFLMGCFPAEFQGAKQHIKTKVGKRPIKEGK